MGVSNQKNYDVSCYGGSLGEATRQFRVCVDNLRHEWVDPPAS